MSYIDIYTRSPYYNWRRGKRRMAHNTRSSLPEFDLFDPSMHAGNELKLFEQWLRRFENRYSLVTTIKADASAADKDADKKQWLLNYVTDNVLDTFESMYDNADLYKAATYADVLAKYKATLKPNQTITLLRHRFHQLKQKDDESFDQFVNRVRREVTYCDFHCNEDRESLCRDQIARGVRYAKIREGVLKNDWGLADLVTNGRRIEAAGRSMKEFGDENKSPNIKMEPAYHINRSNVSHKQFNSFKSDDCSRCSTPNCVGGKKCPAYGKTCTYCRKLHHFESVCFRKKKNIPPPKAHFKQSNAVDVGEDSDSDADAGKSITSTPTNKTLIINAVDSNELKTVPVVMGGLEIDVLPDSGSKANVIGDNYLSETMLSTLSPTKTVLQPYKSEKIIPLGKIYTNTHWGNLKYRTKWYVVDKGKLGNCPPLLSSRTSEALGILQITRSPPQAHETEDRSECSISHVTLDTAATNVCNVTSTTGDLNGLLSKKDNLEALKSAYAHRFHGIGKLNNRQIKLYPRKGTVKPRIAPHKSTPIHLEEKVQKEKNYLIQQDIIEPFDGPVEWCSNPVFVPKPGTEDIRITVNLRAVNRALENTHKPIPNVETLKSRFKGKTVFTKIDFKSAFSQIEIAEESRKFLVFRIGRELYRYKRLAQGLMPASGEFMDAIWPQLRDIAQVEMIHDDVIISGTDQEDHDAGLRAFMQRITELGLTLNASKCIFSAPEVPFWGFIVSKDGIKPDPLKLEALKQQKRPESKHELLSYLAMVRAKQDFLPNIADMTAALRKLTKKGIRFVWTDEHEQEFQNVRAAFNDEIILRYFDPLLPTHIFVDASIHGFGAILCQGESVEKCLPVTIASKATKPVESRYPQIDLEAMAIDFALQRFRYYLVGGPNVNVITDHKPLVPIFNDTRSGSIRSERVKLRHQDINYTVLYQKGSNNMSDYLSRHPIPLEDLPEHIQAENQDNTAFIFNLNVCSYTSAIPNNLLISETNSDKILQRLKHAIYLGHCPEDDPDLKPYRRVFYELSINDNGTLLSDSRAVLPRSLQEQAIDLAHQGGHPGSARIK